MLEICARMELVPILAMVCGVCVTKDTSWDQTARAPVSDKSNMHIQVHLAGRTIIGEQLGQSICVCYEIRHHSPLKIRRLLRRNCTINDSVI